MHFTLRPSKEGDAWAIARVHVLTWQSTYRGLIPDAILDSLQIDKKADSWARHIAETQPASSKEILHVACNEEGEVIGFTFAGKARGSWEGYGGEVYAIYIMQNYQRLGIGKALFDRAMSFLKVSGFSGMLVWVLKDNPAERFYREMGGTPTQSKTETIGGCALLEHGYVWQF